MYKRVGWGAFVLLSYPAVMLAQQYFFNFEGLPAAVPGPSGYEARLLSLTQVQLEGGYVSGPNAQYGHSTVYGLSDWCTSCQSCRWCAFRPIRIAFKEPAKDLSFDLYNSSLKYYGYKNYRAYIQVEYAFNLNGPWIDVYPTPMFTTANDTMTIQLPDGVVGMKVWPPDDSDFFYGIDNLNFAFEDAKFSVGVETEGIPGASTATVSNDGFLTLQLTLGVPVTITGIDGDGDPASATIVLNDQAISPALDATYTFFPDEVVHVFESAAASTLAPVHRGVAEGTITVDGKTADLHVSVVAPAALGTTGNQLDYLINLFAHSRGIPPQWIKSQVRTESDKWNPLSFRYEPLSFDLKSVSRLYKNKKLTTPLREKIPYSRYRLATGPSDGALTQDPALLPMDIAPRESLFVKDSQNNKVPIDASMKYVSARAIYDANYLHQGWHKHNSKLHDQVKAAYAKDPSKDPLAFTAQTTIASSYGLLQVMYTTAISPMLWKNWPKDPNPTPLNPSFLFDTAANVAEGDGSLAIGTAYVIKKYKETNPASETSLSGWGRIPSGLQLRSRQIQLRIQRDGQQHNTGLRAKGL